jgi:hypothetical protein
MNNITLFSLLHVSVAKSGYNSNINFCYYFMIYKYASTTDMTFELLSYVLVSLCIWHLNLQLVLGYFGKACNLVTFITVYGHHCLIIYSICVMKLFQ